MEEKFVSIKKVFLGIISSIVLISLCSVTTFAQAYVQTWNLVDSGKHLDYDGNSTYMSYVVSGVSRWNSYKSGVIRADSIWVIEDVYISDVNEVNGWAGMTYSDGRIELNINYMKNYLDYKRTNVAAHELGHALGLDHSTSTDLMDRDIVQHTSSQALSQNDKDSYDAAYNNY